MFFVTNMPVKTRAELLEIATNYGYELTEEQMLSPSYVTAKYLHDIKFNKKVYMIGSRGMSQELDNFGIQYIDSDDCEKRVLINVVTNGLELNDDVGAVVVSFDEHFSYNKILMAANYLQTPGCLFIGTSFDEVYPTKHDAIVPGTGPLIKAIESASGRFAMISGKPSVNMGNAILAYGNIVPGRTLMIGDSAKFDIQLGYNCGFQTLFVGSGVNSIDEIKTWQQSHIEEDQHLIPDTYLPKLGDLLPLMG